MQPDRPARDPLSILIGAFGCTLLHGATAVASDVSPPDDTATPAVPDATWRALDEHEVRLRMRSGLEVTGKLIGEETDTITVVQPGGSVATLAKHDVASVHAIEATDPSDAAPPPPGDAPPEGFKKSGGYVLLSPGAISQQFTLPYADSSVCDGYGYCDTYEGEVESYTYFQWGVGVGGYLATKSGFAFAGGLALQHATGKVFDGIRANLLRIGPEFRLGGSGKRYFAYGLLDVHGLVYRLSSKEFGPDATIGLAGIGGTFGAGAQGLIGKRFILGGELKSPVDYLFAKQEDGASIGGLTLVALDVRVLLGVKF